MVEKNIYLFIGEDNVSKDRKIASLKKENLEDNSYHFDYELLHADSLDPRKLQELLNSLPTRSKKRVIIIRTADKLSLPNKKILINFAKSKRQDPVLVLDTDKSEIKDAFFQEFGSFAKVFNFASQPALNVFDLGRMIVEKRSKDALMCLSRLLKNGEEQTKVLGVIGWQWRKLRPRMNAREFIKGLELLQQADYNIKRAVLREILRLSFWW
jgi:hypothetical protein